VINRVSGIGDDWLRRIIFSIIPVKLEDTAVDYLFIFLKLKPLIMGKIEQGHMGGFRGMLGTAVGSKWKGLIE
jgi:hypothetical protein